MIPTMDVLATPIKGTLLVEASAGTGKTWTIGALLVRCLAEGRELPQILILTFTEAATADLRERMRHRLEEALASLEKVPGVKEDELLRDMVAAGMVDEENARKRLRRALAQFDEASIFTIHGFCRRVLGEAGLGAGLSGKVELGDEAGEAMERVAMDQLRRWWTQLPDAFMDWLGGQKAGGGRQSRSLLEPALWAAMASKAGEGRVGALEGDFPQAVNQAVWHAAQLILKQRQCLETCCIAFDMLGVSALREELQGLSLNAGSYKQEHFTSLLEDLGAWLQTGASCDQMPKRTGDGAWYFTSTHLRGKQRKGAPPLGPHPFFDAMDALEQACGDLAEAFARLLRALQEEAVATWPARAADLRLQERRLDFSDLLSMVLKALLGPQGARLKDLLQQRWSMAMLDEFQDTDPLQTEIFHQIFREVGHPLVLVGDPKQAIYGFRGADLDAYLKVAASADTQRALYTNWRSDPPLVAAVNQLFQQERFPGQGPFLHSGVAFAPVKACPKPDNRAVKLHGAILRAFHVVQEEQSGISKGLAEERICRHVAQMVERLLGPGACWVRRGTGEDLQSIIGREVAILVRTSRQGQLVAQALAERGLACIQGGRESVWSSAEAGQLVVLLKAMERPDDSGLARALLAGGLARALGGTALDTLHQPDLLLLAQTELHLARARAQTGSLAAALDQFLGRTHWREAMLARPMGERRVVNWNHLLELLRQEETLRRVDPGAMARLAQVKAQESRPSAEWEQRLESEDNLVRIVTMHKSKGLEYPLVFCPFLWAGDARVETFAQLRLPSTQGERRLFASPGMPLEGEEKSVLADASLAESLRLAYVALTRARSQLFCYSAFTNHDKLFPSPLDWLLLGGGLGDCAHPGEKDPWKAFKEQGAEAQLQQWRALEAAGEGVAVEPLCLDEDSPSMPGNEQASVETALPVRTFQGSLEERESSSSFTSLLRDAHADERVDEWFAAQDSPSEGGDADLEDATSAGRDAWAKFPAGTGAGICLHALLETGLDQGGVTVRLCEEELQSAGLGKEHAAFLAPRLDAVLHRPLGGGGPVPLDVEAGLRATELAFHLSTKGISGARLRELCQSHLLHNAGRLGVKEPDTLAALELATRREARPMEPGFLKGFMDLCLCWEGRWWVVDWKSNRLAPNAAAYTRERMVRSMAESGYFLQALLYLTALHRHLKRVDKDHDPWRHLGGLRYVYLRGLRQEDPDSGVLTDILPVELILELDQELGRLA